MTYRVIVSDRAYQMLGSHISFLARVNRSAAQKLRMRFVREIRSLEEMPQRYPFFQADYIPANKYHKMYVENNFLVLYQIKDDTVYVDYIVDCRQDYGWLLS